MDSRKPEDEIRFYWKGKFHKFDIHYLFRRVATIFWVGDNDPSGKKSPRADGASWIEARPSLHPREKDPAAYFANGGTVKEWLPSLWRAISR